MTDCHREVRSSPPIVFRCLSWGTKASDSRPPDYDSNFWHHWRSHQRTCCRWCICASVATVTTTPGTVYHWPSETCGQCSGDHLLSGCSLIHLYRCKFPPKLLTVRSINVSGRKYWIVSLFSLYISVPFSSVFTLFHYLLLAFGLKNDSKVCTMQWNDQYNLWQSCESRPVRTHWVSAFTWNSPFLHIT